MATLAPTIGPTIGGYLTDLFSWHWLFLVNVVPGIIVTLATWFLIDFDKPDFSLLERFDWFGLLGMAAFLGAMEYVLEEGPQKNWFDENIIVVCAVVSVPERVLFFWRAFTAPQPIVDLSAFKNRNFAFGSLVLLRDGHRPLWPDLYLPGLSVAGARLFFAADRRDHVRLGPVHVRWRRRSSAG